VGDVSRHDDHVDCKQINLVIASDKTMANTLPPTAPRVGMQTDYIYPCGLSIVELALGYFHRHTFDDESCLLTLIVQDHAELVHAGILYRDMGQIWRFPK
jgi:hypothetical protein